MRSCNSNTRNDRKNTKENVPNERRGRWNISLLRTVPYVEVLCISVKSNMVNSLAVAIIPIAIAGVGNTYFMMCKPNAISDDYSSCTIWFNDNNFTYMQTGGVNVLGKYAADNEAIVRTLLADTAFKTAMELEEKSEAISYSEGYFKMHESFAQNLNKGYRAWVLVDWDFSHNISVNVVPVCRVDTRKMSNGDDRLAIMVERIKATLNGLSMAMGGELELAEEYSQDEIKLSDELVAGMIMSK